MKYRLPPERIAKPQAEAARLDAVIAKNFKELCDGE